MSERKVLSHPLVLGMSAVTLGLYVSAGVSFGISLGHEGDNGASDKLAESAKALQIEKPTDDEALTALTRSEISTDSQPEIEELITELKIRINESRQTSLTPLEQVDLALISNKLSDASTKARDPNDALGMAMLLAVGGSTIGIGPLVLAMRLQKLKEGEEDRKVQ